MANTVARPPRIISFEQLCVQADPDFMLDLHQPDMYVFSNGRTFVHNRPFYQPPPTQTRDGEWFILLGA